MSLAPIVGKIGDHFARSLEHALRRSHPFEHWAIEDALPAATCKALLAALPETRLFLSPENRARFPGADDVASAFQCRATVREIEEFCGIELRGASLRIEHRTGSQEAAETGGKLFIMHIDLVGPRAGSGMIVVADPKQVSAGGARRALVVEYVTPDWRARGELAYPERPVG